MTEETRLVLESVFWLLAMLFLLTLLQRWLHKALQGVLLLLTHDLGITIGIFSFLFLPGVLLHELSHFFAAKILRVKTGRFSVIPKVLPNGKVQLGYVEVAVTDFVRDSIVGVAPLISGMVVILLVAQYIFGLPILATEQVGPRHIPHLWGAVVNAPDAWVWVYLVFAVSTTMMPSESDRHAWYPLLLFSAGIFGLAVMAGAGDWLKSTIATPFSNFSRTAAFLFGLCNILHLAFLLPIILFQGLVSRLTGYQVR